MNSGDDRAPQGGGVADEFWDQHYRQRSGIGSGQVNPILADVAAELTPGTALDLGCGEGSDTLWLAGRGWQVTAVDVSATVLHRVAARAAAAGLDDRVQLQRQDLASRFPTGVFDLVCAQYLHSPVEFPREQVLHAAAEAVAPGGTLLIVDHGSVPPWSWADPNTQFPTPEQLLDSLHLDLNGWRTLRLNAPQRTATGPAGEPATVTDTVIALTRSAG